MCSVFLSGKCACKAPRLELRVVLGQNPHSHRPFCENRKDSLDSSKYWTHVWVWLGKGPSSSTNFSCVFLLLPDPLIILPYFYSRRGVNQHWFPIKKKFKDLGRQHKYPRIDSRGRKVKQQKEVFVSWILGCQYHLEFSTNLRGSF